MASDLLVLAVVTGHGAVGGLSFDGLAVWTHQDAGHQTQRPVTCRNEKKKNIHEIS